jgi:hypothetical protein
MRLVDRPDHGIIVSLRRGMPSFAHLPESQRWQIITFLREMASSR